MAKNRRKQRVPKNSVKGSMSILKKSDRSDDDCDTSRTSMRGEEEQGEETALASASLAAAVPLEARDGEPLGPLTMKVDRDHGDDDNKEVGDDDDDDADDEEATDCDEEESHGEEREEEQGYEDDDEGEEEATSENDTAQCRVNGVANGKERREQRGKAHNGPSTFSLEEEAKRRSNNDEVASLAANMVGPSLAHGRPMVNKSHDGKQQMQHHKHLSSGATFGSLSSSSSSSPPPAPEVPKKTDVMSAKRFKDEVTGEWTCPVCNIRLDSQHSFTVHIRQHNPTDHSHTCSICDKTLSSASSLDRHMLIHSGERPFKCRICNMAFTTNGNMHRHMRTHGTELNQALKNNGGPFGTSGPAEGDEDANNNRSSKSRKRKSASNHPTPGTGPATPSTAVVAAVSQLRTPTATPCSRPPPAKVHRQQDEEDDEQEDESMYLGVSSKKSSQRKKKALPSSREPSDMDRDGPGGPPKMGLAPAVGFYDLTFTDFSSNKFSLIAKSLCENNARKSSSPYHEFECPKCQRAFPCSSALTIHISQGCSHSLLSPLSSSSSSSSTYCSVCRTELGSQALLIRHRLKHQIEGALPFAGLSKFVHESLMADLENAKGSDKEGFMALLKLQNKDEENGDDLSEQKGKEIVSEDNFDNASYFVHAKPSPPQVHAAVTKSRQEAVTRPPIKASLDLPMTDLADIQSIISITSCGNHLGNIRSSPPAACSASVDGDGGATRPLDSAATESGNRSLSDKDGTDASDSGIHDASLSPSLKINDQVSEDQDSNAASEPIFKCTICPLSFKSVNALKRHNRGHTSGGHSYACHLCPYTSLDKSTLVRHLRTHNGERPFQCTICKYAFTTKANCERHVRKRHKKTSKGEINLSMQYNSNSNGSGLTSENLIGHEIPDDRLYDSLNSTETVCKYCNVDFKLNRVLRHHLRSLHNSCNRKPYCCIICKLGFSTKNNCARHIVKQHPGMDKFASILVNGVTLTSSQQQSGSDLSERESMDTPGNSKHFDMNSSRASSVASDDECMTPSQDQRQQTGVPSQHFVQNLSLAALFQVATEALAAPNHNQPLNFSKLNDILFKSEDSKPFDLTTGNTTRAHQGSNPEQQPLNLTVHALDLSMKTK
ncbi:Ras-responsive element-binding protein 1 [Halotydeus destructor]|nr:Ras-responsive element-binding protein 1 [Halotydeus destructor]